jgi:hypothetical protein
MAFNASLQLSTMAAGVFAGANSPNQTGNSASAAASRVVEPRQSAGASCAILHQRAACPPHLLQNEAKRSKKNRSACNHFGHGFRTH